MDLGSRRRPYGHRPAGGAGQPHGRGSSVTLTWGAATDNIGVLRYNVHRGTTPASRHGGEPDRAADGDGLHRPGLAAGTYYYRVTAEDAAGNVGPASTRRAGGVPPTARAGGADRLQATGRSARRASAGRPPRTTSASRATTSTARRWRVSCPASEPDRPADGHQLHGHGRGRHLLLPRDRGRRGRHVGAASNEASATVTSDTAAPSVSVTAPAGARRSPARSPCRPAHPTTSGSRACSSRWTARPSAPPTRVAVLGHLGHDDREHRPAHDPRAVASDAAGNPGTSAPFPSRSRSTTPRHRRLPAGLVAAYNFDAGAGTTLADATGKGHTGTISGATWSAAGIYGGALSFDGIDDWVTVADAADLDLTNGMTLLRLGLAVCRHGRLAHGRAQGELRLDGLRPLRRHQHETQPEC